MPKVFNKYHGDAPPEAVYIGRGSPWGNPWQIGNGMTREDVLEAYERYADKPQFREAIKKELKGRDVVCFCAPKACHGDIIVRIANEGESND